MGFNFLDVLKQLNNYDQFKKNLLASGQDPRQLLESELKKRNISAEQLQQLAELAQRISKIKRL